MMKSGFSVNIEKNKRLDTILGILNDSKMMEVNKAFKITL